MGDETELQGGRTGECDEQVRALLERAQDPSRVLALSDGVFAIITLLVWRSTSPSSPRATR
jgi:hypothetical protein